MPRLRLLAVFAVAALCGFGGIVGFGFAQRMPEARPVPGAPREAVDIRTLAEGVLVAPQIAPEDVDGLAARGIRTVVALRPDGEAEGQPGSAQIGARARATGIAFAYIPVLHGALPDAAADRLAEVLAGSPGPVLLYCRSGKRAARAWALAEAARPDGLPVAAIEQRVRAVGQPIDDLTDRIRLRAALRAASQ